MATLAGPNFELEILCDSDTASLDGEVMSSNVCLLRLRKEFKEIQKKPVDNIRAAPKESNILEWHYVIEGPKGSLYDHGWYHGTLTFPSDYPYKPPSIQMFTPNGRFKVSVQSSL